MLEFGRCFAGGRCSARRGRGGVGQRPPQYSWEELADQAAKSAVQSDMTPWVVDLAHRQTSRPLPTAIVASLRLTYGNYSGKKQQSAPPELDGAEESQESHPQCRRRGMTFHFCSISVSLACCRVLH